MTELLEKAFAKAANLPQAEQDALARLLLTELADEEAWTRKFAASQDLLVKMAAEALAEDEAGLTEPLDPDRL